MIVVRFEQSENTLVSIFGLPSMVTEVRLEQYLNALPLMYDVTLEGMTTELRPVQLMNAAVPILVTLEGMSIEVRFEQ